jgi:hypothetical protein
MMRMVFGPIPGERFTVETEERMDVVTAGAGNFDWIGLRAAPLERIALLGASLVVFGALYFGMLSAMGFKYAYFRRRTL